MGQRVCERCGEGIIDSEPIWKKLCYLCWKKTNMKKKSNIKSTMVRLGETTTIHNLKKKR